MVRTEFWSNSRLLYLMIDNKPWVLIQNNVFPDLPDKISTLFLDVETTSFNHEKSSVDIWKSCWLAGVAFTWCGEPTIYFLPIRYRDKFSEEKNNDLDLSKKFLQELLNRSSFWVNHNIKYDWHVLTRESLKPYHLTTFCTLTQAKLVQSDRYVYNEDALAAEWLNVDEVDKYKIAFSPYVSDTKDWGEVPIRFMAPYACHDIEKNRLLFHYIKENQHPDVYNISEMECKVTKCLARCEAVGLKVIPNELKVEQAKTTAEMLQIYQKIREEHGIMMRPNTNTDCYEVFHNQLGFPVVGWTEKGDPSYDKYALATLLQYPDVPKELVEDCLKYREGVSHNGFVKAYRKHELNGRIHASYNQTVRTGRMSCKEPNMQQLNKAAKKLIHPHDGYVFLSFDFSSIEFRLLAHYLGQPDIISAYMEDPDTDFHQWVADMCSVHRKPAKNINFCMAYGGGKRKVLSMLANNAEIIKELEASSKEDFESACKLRAEEIYARYHSVLHQLRPLTRFAANRLQSRGYVKNAYGRHRHLPGKAAYRALNTIIQSTAADAMKEAVVYSSPLYNEFLADRKVEQVAYVHDEILFICPRGAIEDWYFDEKNTTIDESSGDISYKTGGPLNEVITEITTCMLRGSKERFNVPMRISASICKDNWADAVELPKELTYRR
jgi:DNA polymerase-1